jgi:hypothetical protein
MVSDVLAKLGKPGTFAVRERVPPGELVLEVAGVGPIRLPVSATDAAALCRVARRARHGIKDRTVLDLAVRDTWEVPNTKVKIDQRRWRRLVSPAVDRIRAALGLPPGTVLEPRLHNLLVYAPGQFFVRHQDSEKADGMIGTLVVELPSEFSGGAIVVRHHDETMTVRGSGKDLTLVAFYADCHHEVRPVQTGFRVVLTYDLFVSDGAPPAFSLATATVDELQLRVREFFRTSPPPRWAGAPQPHAPDRLVYLLDHQYTQRGLDWRRLKNADAIRAAALREVAKRLDCEIVLALADVHESWSCEDEYDDRRRYGGRHFYRYDDEDEHDGDGTEPSTPAVIELIDSEVELRHFVDESGRGSTASSHVDLTELIFTKPSEDLDPFRSEHEGYMGNWGNTVDRWYHRAAVVLWPRARTFVIRAKTSGRWAINEIARALRQRRTADAARMIADVLPFWPRVVGENRSKLIATTLRVARDLDDATSSALLLHPFRVEDVPVSAAPLLFSVAAQYGRTWLAKSCAPFVATRPGHEHRDPFVPNDRRLEWLRSLPAFVASARDDEGDTAIPVAISILTEQWRWAMSAYRAATRLRPSGVLRALAAFDRALLGCLESSVILGATALHDEMSAFLISGACPPLALVRLLRTATETYPADARRALRLEAVRDHARRVLVDELRAPPRAEDDWSMRPPSNCSCTLCADSDASWLIDRGCGTSGLSRRRSAAMFITSSPHTSSPSRT